MITPGDDRAGFHKAGILTDKPVTLRAPIARQMVVLLGFLGELVCALHGRSAAPDRAAESQ